MKEEGSFAASLRDAKDSSSAIRNLAKMVLIQLAQTKAGDALAQEAMRFLATSTRMSDHLREDPPSLGDMIISAFDCGRLYQRIVSEKERRRRGQIGQVKVYGSEDEKRQRRAQICEAAMQLDAEEEFSSVEALADRLALVLKERDVRPRKGSTAPYRPRSLHPILRVLPLRCRRRAANKPEVHNANQSAQLGSHSAQRG